MGMISNDRAETGSRPPRSARRTRARSRRRAAILLVACFGLTICGGVLLQRLRAATQPVGILPGEFERQDALLLAWDSDLSHRQEGNLSEIAAAACQNTRIIVLVPDAATRASATRQLLAANVDPDRLSVMVLPLTRPWIRDFGPLVVKGPDGQPTVVDPHVTAGEVDDAVPSSFARRCNMRIVHPKITMEGGNLLSNGAGLCITTNRLAYQNLTNHGYSDTDLEQLLGQYFGCREVVYLEQLDGEPTGHVDMFATFTAIDTVVVGSCSPEDDPANAEILDRNAARLGGVMTAAGPLKVYRIPMPRPFEGQWPTYTNVVYANGTLLVPSYEWTDPQGVARAVAVYQELLPGWKIVTVDATGLLVNLGALHCASNNIYRLPRAFLEQQQQQAIPAPPSGPPPPVAAGWTVAAPVFRSLSPAEADVAPSRN